MYLFAETNIQGLIKERAASLKHDVSNLPASMLVERNYVSRFERDYILPIPVIHYDKLTVSVKEALLPDPKNEEAEVIVLAIEYNLPVSGDIHILKYGNGKASDIEVDLVSRQYDQCLVLKYTSETREPQQIVEKQKKAIEIIRTNSEAIIAAAEKWNEDLPELIRTELEKREKAVKQIESFKTALGVPEHN